MAQENKKPEDFFGIENIPDSDHSSPEISSASPDIVQSPQDRFVERLLKNDQRPLESRSPSERARLGKIKAKDQKSENDCKVNVPFGHVRFDSDNQPLVESNTEVADQIGKNFRSNQRVENRRIMPNDEDTPSEDQWAASSVKRKVLPRNFEATHEDTSEDDPIAANCFEPEISDRNFESNDRHRFEEDQRSKKFIKQKVLLRSFEPNENTSSADQVTTIGKNLLQNFELTDRHTFDNDQSAINFIKRRLLHRALKSNDGEHFEKHQRAANVVKRKMLPQVYEPNGNLAGQAAANIAEEKIPPQNFEPTDEEADDEILDRRPSEQSQFKIPSPSNNDLNGEEILDNLENEIEHKRRFFTPKKNNDVHSKIVKPIQKVPLISESGDNIEESGVTLAYEEVMRIREEQERQNVRRLASVDRDGSLLALHKLWSLIPDLNRLTKEELIELLVESVLYNENELIAINKPYGLACIGGKGVKYSLSSFLEDLRKRLAPDARRLFLAHRIDKLTTGVLMLTTSERRFYHMKKLFAKRALTKRYWCITRGIVDPPQGTIQIPLGECEVAGHFKIIPMPHQTSENEEVVNRDIRTRFEATTEYKTLATNSGCTLVETNIITGVKHQIRSHLGLGLNCPILGDHKYSHYMKLLPQKLAPVTLSRLGIRPQKSRHLPIYLHAKEVVLPEFVENKNVFIKAPVPKFFLYTLKKLRLAK